MLTAYYSQVASLPPCVWVGLASGEITVWQADAGNCFGDADSGFGNYFSWRQHY
jgi:hypothetical protein